MIHAGSKFLALMMDSAVRSLLLAFFLAVVLAGYRVHAVPAKLLAWRGMLLVALAMPLLILLSPALPLPVRVPAFWQVAASPAAYASRRSVVTQDAPSPAIRSDRISDSIKHQRGAVAPSTPAGELHLTADPRVSRSPFPWILLASALYWTVAAFFLARLFLGMYFGVRLARAAAPIGDAEALRMLEAASREAGLRKLPLLSESGALRVPVTCGISRPAILLPDSWRDWDGDRLRAVLAHEISHVARRDSLVQLVALLHRAVFWFSPLSWWLDHHLSGLAEQASDEAALAAGADRTCYAETLVDFLARLEVPACGGMVWRWQKRAREKKDLNAFFRGGRVWPAT